jgi:hypothetical protein
MSFGKAITNGVYFGVMWFLEIVIVLVSVLMSLGDVHYW